jgi:hypothetical protein
MKRRPEAAEHNSSAALAFPPAPSEETLTVKIEFDFHR